MEATSGSRVERLKPYGKTSKHEQPSQQHSVLFLLRFTPPLLTAIVGLLLLTRAIPESLLELTRPLGARKAHMAKRYRSRMCQTASTFCSAILHVLVPQPGHKK